MSREDVKRRSVFVGNIPYEATEQQLIELFSTAGRVLSFRLISDPQTGMPKGFGFCEYPDVETARSAIRNLANAEFHGRQLRVNFASDDSRGGGGGGGGGGGRDDGAPHDGSSGGQNQRQGGPGLVKDEADVLSSVERIERVLKNLDAQERVRVLGEMKKFVKTRPDEARKLLTDLPDVALALLQIQVGFGMVKPADHQAVLQHEAPPMPPQQQLQQQQQQQLQPPPPPHHQQPPQMPQQGAPLILTPMQQQRLDSLPPKERAILDRVLRLTDADIAQMPEEGRRQIMAVRAKVLGP